MKTTLLILLLAIPAYSQVCEPPEPQIMAAIKQFKPAYKKAEVVCEGSVVLLRMRANRVAGQKLADVVSHKLAPLIKDWGLNKLIIEAHDWDRTPARSTYSVSPVHVLTTRSGGVTHSTISGGRVVEHKRYSYKDRVARVEIEIP
jgi:hypothetical protein